MNLQADKAKFKAGMKRYRQDPISLMVNVLDVKIGNVWSKMREVAESVRDHQFTAVPAAHSVSKSYTAGRVVPWYMLCFPPATVITTAPSDNQVRNILWREIHAAYSGAKMPLGGKMTSLSWDLKPKPDSELWAKITPEQRSYWEKYFAMGFSTSPDTVAENASKIQGFHNKYILVVIDEACGILPQIWNTIMDGLAINPRCKVLAIGNPTDPMSEFYKACQPDSGWNVIPISVLDTPNYKERREVIPGLSGYDYERRMAKKYGTSHNRYLYRVLGQFPTYSEGTYYGKYKAVAYEEKRIGRFPCEPTMPVYAFIDLGDRYTAAIFAQFIKAEIRIVDDYWDNMGGGIKALALAMQSKEYIWAKTHYAGPDLVTTQANNVQTGMATKDAAAQLGLNLAPCMRHSFNDGIEAVRGIWPLLTVNKTLCGTFLKAVTGYRKKKNEQMSTEDETVYYDSPAKSWERHMMDALRHLAVAYRYQIIVKHQRIGYPHPIAASAGQHAGVSLDKWWEKA